MSPQKMKKINPDLFVTQKLRRHLDVWVGMGGNYGRRCSRSHCNWSQGVTSCIPKSWSVYRKSQGNGPRIYHGYERSR